ncbi:hypothetical protein EPUS_06714 [Endocarpon pusillum Z07020]|uniref:DUF7580 domain-containing protein n=1 Tax=Endocarpon pusillum (strain Z07020 / HMAS-L-300199) TaxID=1263415 RepID=U1HPE2_ENDPU|nr:uncharacterized protein EPUS_06714 [Endocarpon pusillum Z07020]ERF70929.1 hypothetical protein EPUS_06714 [Endocarpon pusillum Z07020]
MAEVGIALGVLPLIIAGAQHYSKAETVFCQYRHFTSELSYLATRLKVQRAIFKNASKKLISLCVGQEEARIMLEDLEHPGWTDPAIDRAFSMQLQDSCDAFADSLQTISSRLTDLEKECQKFEGVLHGSQSDGPGDARSRARLIAKKIKFVFRDSRTQLLFNSVRDLTEDFCALITQIDPSYTYEKPPLLPAGGDGREVAKFGSIKNAAENLYEALGAACTKHTEHQVHFSLQPSYISSSPDVRFHIGFRQLLARCVGNDAGPTWLTIESRVSDPIMSVPKNKEGPTNLEKSLKRNKMSPSPPPGRPPKKRQKNVRFRSQTPPPICQTLQPDTTLPNLCSHGNLCNQLSQLLSQSLLDQNRCIGLLGDLSNRTHLIYLDSRTQSLPKGTCTSPSSSLKDVLNMVGRARKPFNSIPQLERIRLAKQLAIALLSFHSTSWLDSTWCSENVFLYNTSNENPQFSFKLDDPYVNVAIKGPCSPTPPTPGSTSRSFAPNPFLFGLGVMLLEIAFETPLRSLQRSVDIEASQDDRHTEFFTAKRVSKMASRPLGIRYNRIVRSCLNCDFRGGDDLNESALQEAIYRDVIFELDRLEEKLRRFNLED